MLKQTSENKITFRRKELPQKAASGWLLQGILRTVLFAAVAGLLCSVVGIWEISSPWIVLAAGLLLCAAASALQALRFERWFVPGLATLLMLGALLFRRELAEGVCLIWNQWTDVWIRVTGTLLPLRQLTGRSETRCLWIAGIVLGGLLVLLADCCVRRAKGAAAIGLLVLLGGALLTERAALPWLALALLASGMLILASDWKKHDAGAVVLTGTLSLVLLVLLLHGLLQILHPVWLGEIRQKTADAIHAYRYETEYSVLPEGDFSNETQQDAEGYTALVVTMETPERVFLRGFVGDRFADEKWSALEKEVLSQEKELLYWIRANGLYPQAQLAAAAGEAAQRAEVAVQNVNGCSRYVYAPHTLIGESLSGLSPEKLDPSVLAADGWKGQRIYSYQVLAQSAEETSALLEQLQKSDDAETLAFRRNESAYRRFVLEQDLQVPNSFAEQLGHVLDLSCEAFGAHTELTKAQAQASTLDFLTLCFSEKGSDLVLPLQEQRGSIYQYTTMTVLALRYYGIAARYAEGYEINAAMAAAAEPGAPIAVDNSCGRAWVEIYQDGIGWMPMELTPGFEALIGQMGDDGYQPVGVGGIDPNAQVGSTEGDGEGAPLAEGQERENDDGEKDQKDGLLSAGGTMALIQKALRWSLLLLVLLVLLLLGAVVFRRVCRIAKKKKQFGSEDLQNAVCRIFTDAVDMLEAMGVHRNGGSMLPVCKELEALIGEEYAKSCEEMYVLNGKALFSSHSIAESDRSRMMQFRAKTLEHLKRRVRWYRKIWLQWWACLY